MSQQQEIERLMRESIEASPTIANCLETATLLNKSTNTRDVMLIAQIGELRTATVLATTELIEEYRNTGTDLISPEHDIDAGTKTTEPPPF